MISDKVLLWLLRIHHVIWQRFAYGTAHTYKQCSKCHHVSRAQQCVLGTVTSAQLAEGNKFAQVWLRLKIEILRKKPHVCMNIASSFRGLFCLLLTFFYSSWQRQEVTGAIYRNSVPLVAVSQRVPMQELPIHPRIMTTEERIAKTCQEQKYGQISSVKLQQWKAVM